MTGGAFDVFRSDSRTWSGLGGFAVHAEQEKWAEHAAFMNALADDGFVVLGGPLGDGARILLIIDAESEGAIQTRLAADPWTPTDLLRIAKVERWEILLGAVD
jgi:uncharacterized protein YciI